jgi:hypothetical protein
MNMGARLVTIYLALLHVSGLVVVGEVSAARLEQSRIVRRDAVSACFRSYYQRYGCAY